MTLAAVEADDAFSRLSGLQPSPQPREAVTEQV